jgi:hypothetical protein
MIHKKAKQDDMEPRPPAIPSSDDEHEFKIDGWEPSEDPREGRWVDTDDECEEQHADR